jgi:S-adenosylmethionine synthetase
MLPPLLPRLGDDLAALRELGVDHVRAKVFKGVYEGRRYPEGYTEPERALILENSGEYVFNKPYLDGMLSFKGKLCTAGVTSFKVTVTGDVRRCASVPTGYGNLYDGTFEPAAEPEPCPARRILVLSQCLALRGRLARRRGRRVAGRAGTGMRIVVSSSAVHPDAMPYDVAEREGIGHPDSLADLVADAFSRRYALTCLERFGTVPNHWVDKVTLVGAASHVSYGGFTVQKPVDGYLFGKVTGRIGGEGIDVDGMFRQVVEQTLAAALGDDAILGHLDTHGNNTSGTAADHDPEFYAPAGAGALRRVLERESVANDTVICTGNSTVGLAGRLAGWLETFVNTTGFRERFPMVGSDVKVMVARVGEDFDVTAAVPVLPQAVVSWQDYRAQLTEVETALIGELKAYVDDTGRIAAVTLNINTKDTPGRAYLAPFGTSLGKGDCGAVGRGNRSNGVIEPLRPAGCEAPRARTRCTMAARSTPAWRGRPPGASVASSASTPR